MAKIIHFPTAEKSEVSKSIAQDIVKEAHEPVAEGNVVPFAPPRPKSIR